MLEYLAQTVVGGLSQGALYALAALGIVVIFNATEVVNFAQGAMGAALTYLAYVGLQHFHLPYPLAVLAAMAISFGVGVVVQLALMRRLSGASTWTQIVLTLGLFMFVQGATGLMFGYDPRLFPEALPIDSLIVGNVAIRPQDLLDLAILGVLVVLLALLFGRTKIGLAMRAINQNPFAARLMGVPFDATLGLAWGIGVTLAAAAAILSAPVTTLTPTMMDTIVLYGFVAAILGGFGSFGGAIIGGLLLGVVDNLIKSFFAPQLSLTFVFVLLLVVLYVLPNGLFGRGRVQKV
ncbi:MAG TPA: branched-chain amino acid ABC transporter permease [Candidatus Acidoferrales bacterium]|nr:branched-chain amino acid ABC transporter permease [Candidatus Acidoferrales bacterium]